MTLPADIRSISQHDLERLISDSVREGQHVEFKRDLPTAWTNEAKHEFLADVTAFANAAGGDLIFGVDEDGQGQAEKVVPLSSPNIDQEIRKLQDFLLNLVEPRLPGLQLQAVPTVVAEAQSFALVIRIPQSWAGPHRVRTNQHFFVRDGLRKRQLDIPEIRSLFLRSEDQAQRVKDFRTQRLGQILSGETPHKLVPGPVLVAHFIPTQAAVGLVRIDPVPYTRQRGLPTFDGTGGSTRLNIDGILVSRSETPQGETYGYSQLFRNGFFEATHVVTRRADNNGDKFILPSLGYEQKLITMFANFRSELQRLEIGLECAVMLSLTRADEVKLGVRDDWGYLRSHETIFDRRIIALPDVLTMSDLSPEQALKPAFDLLWQAAGLPSSRNYDEAGNWSPQK